MHKVIVLMGIKHCGKSTQGRLLSKYYNYPFFDTDDVVKKLTGKTPRQIYTEQSQQAFMDAEAEACDYLCKMDCNLVIATGGGICNNQKALALLKQIGKFVFLNVEESVACNRIIKEINYSDTGELLNLPAYIKNKNPRTVDDVRAIFHDFYAERVEKYKALSDIEVCIGNAASDINMQTIVSALD